MDKTIKSLKGSPEYSTKEQRKLQVQRFAMLLEPYHALMQQWMSVIPEEQYLKWAEGIWQDSKHNSKEAMLFAIQRKFDSKKDLQYLDEKQLLPSGKANCVKNSTSTDDIIEQLEIKFRQPLEA